MKIAVRANTIQEQGWREKKAAANAEVIFCGEDFATTDADCYFDLLFDERNSEYVKTSKPVFANAVVNTLNDLPPNYVRINAWNGFLQRSILEIVSSDANKKNVEAVMNLLGWRYIFAPDVPGMIAARSISMIVNEAYFALAENISTKEEIDIAMKLGTNYPYGPFEWSEKIGLQKIFSLLEKLAEREERYTICSALANDIQIKKSNN